MMREELGLISGHVDVDRTFRLAGLAGQAEIERIFDISTLPAAVERVALEHFKEQAGAAASGMLLLFCGHVAGAHGAAGLNFAALAYADAARGDLREVAVRFR